MNPANFANMSVPQMGPQTQAVPQQGRPKQGVNGVQAAQARIMQMIQLNQQQYPVQGWQTTLPIQLRVTNVFHIFSQVRQVKYDMTPDNAIQVAVHFEHKTFQEAADKAEYDLRCYSKLQEIAQTRNQLAKAMQPQLQNNQHPQMNMGQQQVAMTGMPNPMQQQQMQQQMQQRFMQQQQQQQQQQQNQIQGMPMPPQAQMPMGNPQVRMQGMPPNMTHPVPQPTQQPINQQPSLTPAELQQIPTFAHRLITGYPKDQLAQITNRLQHDNPNIPMNNLLLKYFSTMATQKLLMMKSQQMMPMVPGPNSGPVPQQTRPVSQVSAPPPNQQPTPVSAPQPLDPSFMGNFEQLRQNAIRSQELGQVVVPASQGVPQQQRAPGGGTPAVAQNGGNRAAQTPQIPQQPQQPRNQQNGQTPQQSNVFPGMSNVPQNVFQGQNGGLSKEARTPQQNANMPNLNRAFGPQVNQPNMQNQQNQVQSAQQNGPTQSMQNNQARMAQLQQAMQKMTEGERRSFMMRMQAEKQQRQHNAGAVPLLQQKSQPGQSIPVGPQPLQNPQPTSRSGQPSTQPQQPVNGQPQPQQRNKLQQEIAKAASDSLTSEQEQQMDGHPYPPGILAAGNALSQLPGGVKTWGQLKNWVKANAGNVPPGSEQKLRGLQGLHYQSLQPKKNIPPQNVRNAAPPAQMMPGPNQPSNLPQIPQTTPQDISSARQRYSQLAGKSDEEIKNIIMGQRARQFEQQRSQFAQQQAQQQVQQQVQQQAQIQMQHGPVPQNLIQQQQLIQQQKAPQPPQRTQPQQVPKTGAQSKPQPAPITQTPAQNSMVQKGVKRISSDDVMEVPNPNLNQQRSQAKPQPKAPAANMGQIPAKPVDAPKVQAVQRDKVNPQAAQQPAQGRATTAEAIKSDERFKEIVSEVRQVLPQRQPVPMDPDTRTKMIQKIAENKRIFERMGPFMTAFWKVFHDEKGLRTLTQLYGILAQQFKNENQTPENTIDRFTIGPEELEKNLSTITLYFNTTMARMASQQNTQPAKEPTPALSAANLQQHQNDMNAARAREASAKKGSNRAPPAPTSAQAPNPWVVPPPSSPHGVPSHYGEPRLTQDKLHLPRKKLKNNTGAPSPPAHLIGTPGSAASPLVITKSPELQKTPAPAMLKCSNPNCADVKGFVTSADLEKHMEKHEVKEPIIDDPLKFALEQMRNALNLDENGKSKPKADSIMVEAPTMKQSASMQGLKQEASTPMSRVPTGQSPASQAKSLQPPKTQATPSNALPDVILPDDPWANSFIRQETINEAFSPLATLPGMKSFTRIQDHLTPESSSSDATDPSKNSPRPSDVSENDAVKISMEMDKSWIPVDWYDDSLAGSDFELLDLNMDSGAAEPMDWDNLFGETAEESQARAEKGQNWIERELAAGRPGMAEDFEKMYAAGDINLGKR